MEISEQGYRYLLYFSYILYVVSFLGISYTAPQYHKLLIEIIKIYICLLLIKRFNPITRQRCTSFDKELAFSAAFFLLLTTIIGEIAVYYTENVIKKVKKKV